MERPGEKLRQIRERLKLTYRDVAVASQQIAMRRDSEEFAIALSRLADIENKGTVPTIYRIYTLCAIYRLNFHEVVEWYGVPLEFLPGDAMQIKLDETHAVNFPPDSGVGVPLSADRSIDVNQTTFLGHLMRRSGKIPFHYLNSQDVRNLRYGLIGLTDWSMHPILHPGSLVLIDQTKRKIVDGGWTNELDRPVYFLEHREGCRVGWCSVVGGRVLLLPHPSAQVQPCLFEHSEVDVVGQITGVAMLLETKRRRHVRTSAVPVKSPNQ
jgi:transcriptional regulator with XRE-family HTH domain